MMTTIKPSIMVAVDIKNGFSRNNKIPWSIKEDMTYFQDVTSCEYVPNKKNAIIVGKNTWNTLLPDGLNNRINIIISSSLKKVNLPTKNETVAFSDLTGAINFCQQRQDIGKIFICGGKQIYKETLMRYDVDEIYLSRIHKDYNCDLVFDSFDENKYKINIQKHFNVLDTFTMEQVPITFTQFCKNIPSCKKSSEQQYLDMLEDILKTGQFVTTRNGKTFSKFGKTLEFDLHESFPLITTKKVFFRGVVEELLFFLRGETDTKILSQKGIKIWEPNTSRQFLDSVGLKNYVEGDIGAMYGYQLKHFNQTYFGSSIDYKDAGFNQINYCINLLKNDPTSRRIIMTTYNPLQAKQGVLFPCHGLFIQFYVDNDHRLSCMMTQRSADSVCGVPFNIASYALLVHIFCEIINNDNTYTGRKFSPGKLIMNFGDVHIYEEHKCAAIRQILRDPKDFPQISFNKKITDFNTIAYDDIVLTNYLHHTPINVKMIA